MHVVAYFGLHCTEVWVEVWDFASSRRQIFFLLLHSGAHHLTFTINLQYFGEKAFVLLSILEIVRKYLVYITFVIV